MKYFFILCGPSVLILLGLKYLASVPWTFVLFYSWLFFIPFFDLLISRRYSFSKTLERLGISYEKRSVLWGFLSGIFSFLIICGGLLWLHEYFFDINYLKGLLASWNFSGRYVLLLSLVLIFINPLLEEVYWRGYAWQELELRSNAKITNLLTAFFYSLYHLISLNYIFIWPFNIMGVGFVFLAGVIWGCLRSYFNSLWGPIISHVLADLGIITIYLKFIGIG
ncbi:MAG: CPBP family intramembrane glutamic endopeptidase [Peptococcaceae bacterium]